jgi:hypothetical protein
MQDDDPVDYQFWSKLDGWSFRDAALLLCGFDPDAVRGSGIRLDSREHPEHLAEASKVYRVLKSTTALGPNVAHPFSVIEHALKKNLPMPTPLLGAVRARFRQEREREGQQIDEVLGEAGLAEPHPRSRRFLLRLIYVMATRGYGLKLEQPYNDANEIVVDAERLGLVLDRDAVARYLKEARQQAEPKAIEE